MKIRSLLYHDVLPDGAASEFSGFSGASAFAYKLGTTQFETHLAGIHEGATRAGVPVSTIERVLHGKLKESILITFDDGGVSALLHAAPMLEARGFRGHFFIATDYIGKPGFLTEAQIRELEARGHVIGSHSCSHPLRMADLSHDDLLREWKQSLERLSSILGRKVELASVPGGLYSRAVGLAASQSGVKILFTSEPEQYLGHVKNMMLVGRFSVVRSDSPQYAARLAGGDQWLCRKQWALWNTKKLVKSIAGRPYLWARERYFRARH